MDQSAALQCRELRKHYGRHAVLQGVDLPVLDGSIHGLVGLNGAGKTTTLECILGLRPKDGGSVSILGHDPEQLHRAGGKVAVVFDSPCLHPQLTVRQCLELARLQRRQTALPIAKVEELLGIARYRDFKVRQLSLGNRRRAAIAQALINQPRFVILDEPFNGLDAGGVDDVLTLIRRLNREQGTSFLLASHQLAYLEKICTHVAILHAGKIRLTDTMTSLLSQDQATVSIVTPDVQQANVVLEKMPGVEVLNDQTEATGIHCRLQNISSAELNAILVRLDIAVEQLLLTKPSLETVFYNTVNGAVA